MNASPSPQPLPAPHRQFESAVAPLEMVFGPDRVLRD
jgi:hypothetical protein